MNAQQDGSLKFSCSLFTVVLWELIRHLFSEEAAKCKEFLWNSRDIISGVTLKASGSGNVAVWQVYRADHSGRGKHGLYFWN